MSQYRMIMLKVADVSNNEINVCSSNPCEQKAQVFNVFFDFQPELMSVCDGFLHMDICYVHSA